MYNPRIVELYDDLQGFERYPFHTSLQALNIKDYGALCDGVTDDTAAIQKAIDDVIDNGIILIPQGITKYSTLDIGTKTVTLKGVGAFLKQYGEVGDDRWYEVESDIQGSVLWSTLTSGIAIDATYGRIHLEGLALIGANGLTTGVKCGIVSNPYRVLLRWRDVSFGNWAIAAHTDNIYESIFEGLNFRGNATAFHLEGCNASTLIGCSISSCETGVHLEGSANASILGGAIQGITGTGLLIDDSEEATIQGVYFENVNADYAINTSGVCDRLNILNNHASTAGDKIRIGGNHCLIWMGKYGAPGGISNLILAGNNNIAYLSYNHTTVTNTGTCNMIHKVGPLNGEFLSGGQLVFDGTDPVLKSPDGTLYAVRVADNGTLSTVEV